MSILLRHEIEEFLRLGKITAYGKPLDPKDFKIGVNSIDITLGSKLKSYYPFVQHVLADQSIYLESQSDLKFIDSKKDNVVYEFDIPEEGVVLSPNMLYLGHSNEALGSAYAIPMYEGRSSMARLGIQSHISAGFGDIGFDAQWTLEINVTQPTKIYPNMRIGQVFFTKLDQKEVLIAHANKNLYDGKYGNQHGVQESKSFKDF